MGLLRSGHPRGGETVGRRRVDGVMAKREAERARGPDGVGRQDAHAPIPQRGKFLRGQGARFPAIVLPPVLEPYLGTVMSHV